VLSGSGGLACGPHHPPHDTAHVCVPLCAVVGIANRAAMSTATPARLLCSVRRQAKQQGVPARLFASHNRGGVPELGGHRRQGVRWQCDRLIPAARLFLAHRRRRRLPEHSCGWRRARQRTTAVRRCAPSRAATHPDARGTKNRAPHPHTRTRPATARVGAWSLRRCGLLRWKIRLCECDCDCRAECGGANAQPSRRYGRSPLNLAAWPARPRTMRRAARIFATCHFVWWCPECLAAFGIGSTNSNDCPQKYSRLETEAACKSLAAIAGVSMDVNSQAYKYYPAGCFRHTVSGKFYWNTHGSGASNSFAQPLCAGAPQRRHARQMNASLNCCSYVPHHHQINQHTSVSCTRYLGGYSGTRQSGSTRVLTIQSVTGYSGTGRAWLGSTQAVLGYSLLRLYPGAQYSGGSRGTE
jgi:hypothetical protein